MTTLIFIKLLNNPSPFEVMDIVINGPGGFVFPISKTFVSGVPANANQVQIELNKFQTTQSLINNLEINNANANVVFSLDLTSDTVVLSFITEGEYTVTVNQLGANIEVSGVETEIPDPNIPDPTFENAWQNADFQIQIIDTYENDRELIVELTRASAPVLNFQGGDDIVQTVYAGNLSFDMRVAGSKDAHFIHLFTGDEFRYKVKLNVIDEEENAFLVWQGFLLPDQYEEPYIQVQQFVSFKATDMLATLKGKKFPVWYYFQKMPMMFLIAEILKLTGLEQDIVVKPGVLPEAFVRGIEGIIINMDNYRNEKDFTSVNEILEDVLESFGLVLYSIKGLWYIESFARRNDGLNQWLKFTYEGKPDGVFEYQKPVRDIDFSAGSINITTLTPFNKVIYTPQIKKQSNLYPPDVMSQDFDSVRKLRIAPGNFVVEAGRIYTNINRYWFFQSQSDQHFSDYVRIIRKYVVLFGSSPVFNNYNINAAQSSTTYYRANIRPYVLANNRYRLRIQGYVFFEYQSSLGNTLKNSWEAGRLNQMFTYRVYIGTNEIISNFPNSSVAEPEMKPQLNFNFDILPPVVQNQINPPAQSRLDFTVDYEFPIENSGEFDLRVLKPIANNIGVGNWSLVISSLTLDILTEEEYVEEIVATRPVSFTTIQELKPALLATTNRRVLNSLNVGFPIVPNYFFELNRSQESDFTIENPSPIGGLYNLLDPRPFTGAGRSLEITDQFRKILFGDEQISRAVFVEKENGQRYSLSGVGVNKNIGRYWFDYITEFTPQFRIPVGFKVNEVLEPEDKIKFMYVWYNEFDYALNDRWKTFDSEQTGKLGRCLTYLHHAVNSEPCYRIDGQLLGMILPDELFGFFFDDDYKEFVPTSININLFEGKTTVTGRECNYQPLNDITYE
jgi:hypothetical protein